MPRISVRTLKFGSRKTQAARQAVARAASLLRARSVITTRAPFRTGGFFGVYTRRGRDELKTNDVTQAQTDVPAAGAFTLLSGVAQGDDFNERVGRKIIIKSLLIRIAFSSVADTSAPIGDTIRMLVFQDLQTNGAAPGLTDVLSGIEPFDPMNLNNRERFRVLIDKMVSLPANAYAAGALSTGSPTPKSMKLYKKLNTQQVFSGTGNTVASIATGSIYMLLLANNDNVSTSQFSTRIRFLDA